MIILSCLFMLHMLSQIWRQLLFLWASLQGHRSWAMKWTEVSLCLQTMEWTNVGKSSSNSYRLASTSKFDLNTHLFGLSAHLSPQNSSGLVWAECLSYLTNGEFKQCLRSGPYPRARVWVDLVVPIIELLRGIWQWTPPTLTNLESWHLNCHPANHPVFFLTADVNTTFGFIQWWT